MRQNIEKKLNSLVRPRALKPGDKVAIVSLSSGKLGEEFCRHSLKLGMKRLEEMGLIPVFMPNARKGVEYLDKNPEARAQDLKAAFQDDSISGIICAIGGDDTYRLAPWLMEDEEFKELVRQKPKIFTGFSDTTVNHLMLYRLGLATYYGPCFLCDLAEMEQEMLPYTKRAFQGYFQGMELRKIEPSKVWYQERTDFSSKGLGTERIRHQERRGFQLIQGEGNFQGRLLGGCLESIYDLLTGARYGEENAICQKYHLFPEKEEWKGKILFVETCEEKPEPKLFENELTELKKRGVFEQVNGIIVGKPQDETYYQEYKEIWKKVIGNPALPVLYNVNFGHAYPRCVIPYGVEVQVLAEEQKIILQHSMFSREKDSDPEK